MHVVFRRRVHFRRNPSISKPLHVIAFVLHGLIVGDDSDFDAGLVACNNCVGEVVVGDVEDADIERLLGAVDVVDQLLHVRFAWEEESLHVARFRSVQVLLSSGDVGTQVFEDLFVTAILHLRLGNLEKQVHSLLTSFIFLTFRHLVKLSGQFL